jgi:Uma2 family endonuclease
VCYIVLDVMAVTNPYAETIVPRVAVTFPLPVPAPQGFDPDRLETWPEVTGRLEYVDGVLWYMPPCGEVQQETTADVVSVLTAWRRAHPDFVVGTNEAGMKLGGAVRGADAAVWRKADVGPASAGVRRVPPVLAVEVAGIDDTVELLRAKARWYLMHGTEVVWLVIPDERSVIVVTASGEVTLDSDRTIPRHPSFPDLEPSVRELFRQIDER